MIKFLLPFLLSATCFAQSTNEDHHLLWEISGNGLKKPSYLFGSLHSNDKRLFKMSDSTYIALNASTMIALETDVFELFEDWDTRRGVVELKYDNEGNPYNASSEASETSYGNEDGMPQFLDAYFEQYCLNAGKEFAPLESLDYQLNLFSDMKIPRLEDISLESLLTSKEGMIDLYLKGDIYRLDDLLKASLSIYPTGYKTLITDRNFKMADKIDSLLLNTNHILFCAVGAGHLAGGMGMINILRSKGYNMRKLGASYSEEFTKEKKEILSHREFLYRNDSIGLSAKFPGKPKSVNCEDENCMLKLIYRDLGQGNTYSIEAYSLEENSELEQVAYNYIASPSESPIRKINLDDGSLAFEGLADAYPEGLYWTRIITGDSYFFILKAYGGNKFMNSQRAQHFFGNVWIDY